MIKKLKLPRKIKKLYFKKYKVIPKIIGFGSRAKFIVRYKGVYYAHSLKNNKIYQILWFIESYKQHYKNIYVHVSFTKKT